ncbi:MAG: phage major capsid protein [Armatimonadia bacterium]
MAEIGSMIASTMNNMGRSLVDQVMSEYPLTAYLNVNDRVKPVDGGLQIQEPLSISLNPSVTWRNYREKIDFAEDDPFTFAVWDWRFLNGSVSWFEAQEKMCQGKSQIFDFVEEKIGNFRDSMKNGFSTGLWGDGSGKTMHGIQALFSYTNTYGGINRVGNTWWQPMNGTVLSTVEPLVLRGGTDGGIRKAYNLASGNGGAEPPDFAATTELLYTRIESLIDPQRIYENPKMIELGFPNHLMIDNMTVVWDTNCPTGWFPMLNSKYVKLRPHTGNVDSFNLTPRFDLYPEGQRGKAILGEWMGNMTCTRPNRQGLLTGKTA